MFRMAVKFAALYFNEHSLEERLMKTVKKTAEYTVLQRADGRYAVLGKNKNFINGDDKIAILVTEGLRAAPAPKAEEPSEEAAEESSEDTAE